MAFAARVREKSLAPDGVLFVLTPVTENPALHWQHNGLREEQIEAIAQQRRAEVHRYIHGHTVYLILRA
ncbi:hypothetical protein [Streptomyces albireticuli]|uniref:hypothetical protein n=1 Tax=Streptomyces albireticuli TaxID=1940 RepID=UPI001E627A2C|nr:hypothetical protein [Streptomyces albireticuli]MCD9145468.1 hypothetical protein [Streptomyces albireticuli]MCD9164967.1 hypothetical protein [Streptomyces albireticuli]MCD9195442.1 hypothetical protein [Streptomyces albireticuli]